MHTMTELTASQLDRARGALIGCAVGDALGVPYEFAPPLSGTEEPVMRGGGLGDFAPGEWSDDTAMAIAVARAAAAHRELLSPASLDAVADGFHDWYATDPPDVGNQTRRVLSAARTGTPMRAASDDLAFAGHRTGGNGALMRTAPVALAHLHDRTALAEAARSVARLTHYDPRAGDSCVLWCEAIRIAVLESRIDVYAGLDLLPAERRDEWTRLLDAARDDEPGTFAPNGYTVTALQAAASSILHASGDRGDHVRDALYTAIRIGDDTDTVAAIAGSLLGARWGVSAFAAPWRAAVHGWPRIDGRDSTSADIVELVDRITAA